MFWHLKKDYWRVAQKISFFSLYSYRKYKNKK